MDGASPLPYRCGPEELQSWLRARARGRSRRQLRDAAGSSTKAFEGATATAVALGFWDPASDAPTVAGERLALASSEAAEEILREALLGYPPYHELMSAVARRGSSAVTEADWLETWLATRGYGSSESNRREAVASLGRLVDGTRLGRYIPGRRGHPTRVEWDLEPVLHRLDLPVVAEPTVPEVAGEIPPPPRFQAAPSPPPPVPQRDAPADAPAAGAAPSRRLSRLTLPLSDDLTVRVEVPTPLPPAEKRRLLQLLDLLIGEG